LAGTGVIDGVQPDRVTVAVVLCRSEIVTVQLGAVKPVA
jgi:hypothetical protein